MEKLKDKVAVFIGGGSAVASVALRYFMEEGAKVLQVDIADRYLERTADLREQYPERIRTFLGACTSQEEMDAAMKYAADTFGRIDILCNFAGFHGAGDATQALRSQWDMAMDVTCLGIYRAVLAVYPYLKEQHGGRIMNFTSIGGRANRGVSITYAASKAAAIGLTRALALELAPDNITVNSMAPASLDTSSFERIPEKGSIPHEPPKGVLKGGPGAVRGGSFIPDRPVATLDEIAHVIVFMCSDDSAFLTGDCLDVNGGQYMQP
ncbi:MAG: SDR family oxidoreductase [Lachnospiraceae bacterium]|nr:SDR family oxidoreductase [Lachnospiraceae bacterium]